MLEKKTQIDQIEVTANATVQVRTRTVVLEDGVELTNTLHRHVITPGQDYSQEDAKVQAICKAVHTPEVITTYQTSQSLQPE